MIRRSLLWIPSVPNIGSKCSLRTRSDDGFGQSAVTKNGRIRASSRSLKGPTTTASYKNMINKPLQYPEDRVLLVSLWPSPCPSVGVLWHYKSNSQPSLKEIQQS